MTIQTTVGQEGLDAAIRAIGRDKWEELLADAERPRLGLNGWIFVIVVGVTLGLNIGVWIGYPPARASLIQALSGAVSLIPVLMLVLTPYVVYGIRKARQAAALKAILQVVAAGISSCSWTSIAGR